MQEHTLARSAHVAGRLALDSADGYTLSSGQAIELKDGVHWLAGSVEADGATYWFIPEDGTFENDRIALRPGVHIRK